MKKLTVLPLLLLLPVIASADPGEATRYLINEPASMMDVGLVRITQNLDEQRIYLQEQYENSTGTSGVLVTTYAEYSFKDDKIGLYFLVGASTSSGAELGCRHLLSDVISYMKDLVHVAFTHDGYSTKNRPDNYDQEVLERTDLHCSVRNLVTKEDVITATVNLIDEKISVVKEIPGEN